MRTFSNGPPPNRSTIIGSWSNKGPWFCSDLRDPTVRRAGPSKSPSVATQTASTSGCTTSARTTTKYGNREDDFMKVVDLILRDRLIFATPVYWYSMNSTMKVFFDRLTDLTDIEKEEGLCPRRKASLAHRHRNGRSPARGLRIFVRGNLRLLRYRISRCGVHVHGQ